MGILDELSLGNPPATLYHYTSQDGLLGILNTNTLWATKIQYLNDSTEYLFAIELTEQLLSERLEGEVASKEREKIKGMQRNLWGISHMNVCVCSFSEKRDILSQWRAYGGSSGFSIGFNSANLLAKAKEQGFIVTQCVYEEERQKTLIYRLIDETLAEDFNTQPGYIDPDRPRTFIVLPTDGGFHRNLASIAPVIKNKAFHEEQEWRLVAAEGINVQKMSFRSGQSMVIPYYSFHLGQNKEEYLDAIVIGPTPHPELSKISIESFLAHWSASQNVKAYMSKVPYRNW